MFYYDNALMAKILKIISVNDHKSLVQNLDKLAMLNDSESLKLIIRSRLIGDISEIKNLGAE